MNLEEFDNPHRETNANLGQSLPAPDPECKFTFPV